IFLGTTIEILRLAHIPTPLQRLDRLSELWGGEIWIKRDDLTGSGLSGNKVRKLEYLLTDAAANGADTLITCGGIQSNHCRATALTAARMRLKCRLLLRGIPPRELDGNLLLDRLAGAEIQFIDEDRYQNDLSSELRRIAEDVKSRGGNPYIIPEGGSNHIGARGYVQAAAELHRQCDEIGLQPKRIVCATGSGGTHAGLWFGVKSQNWAVEIWSASVCYDRAEIAQRIHRIILDMISSEQTSLTCGLDDILVLDGYRGLGYAKADKSEFDVIIETAREEGIIVDPVYTGKAARAIKAETQAGRMPGATIFWHTGGVFGLFPFRRGLEKALKTARADTKLHLKGYVCGCQKSRLTTL
ncbi:MAG: D-cysteine desulfhydrase family protein, partial [Calditrichota bacterium]